MSVKQKHILSYIAAISIAAMFLFTACDKLVPKGATVQSEADTILTPVMMAYDTQTLVSDSGFIKVRITSKEYHIFKKDTISYWLFPKGLYVERLNRLKKVNDSEIICKYAKYFDVKEFWELRDSVVAKNIDNEVFQTDLLYWDNKKKIVYTDHYIRIVRPDKDTIEGYGFQAQQDFSKWEIKNTNATFKFEMEE